MNTIIVAAYPERGAGNDTEAVGLAFHQGPTFTIYNYCMGGV